MGSLFETLLANFDLFEFIKEFIGNLADGDDFKDALSSGSSK